MNGIIYKTSELYDLTRTLAAPLLAAAQYPWQALPGLKEFIIRTGATLPDTEYERRGEDVWIARTAKVAPTAYIAGPCIIMDGAEIRHCAYIRGSAVIGRGSVLGNSCEIKNSILFDSVQVPHFNYIGDSILGYKAHLGAGAITSNIKSDRTNIIIRSGELSFETGMRKIGAMVGDNTEVGCNSVLCPGTVIGRDCVIYPLVRVRGVIPHNSIHKGGEIVQKTQSAQ